MVLVLVQIDSFRSRVVVTLSANVLCTHLYYCSMSCLYCNMLHISQATCIYLCTYVWVCLHMYVCLCGCEWVDVFVSVDVV